MSCAVNEEILESLYEESLEEIEQFYKLKNKVVSVDQIDEEAIKCKKFLNDVIFSNLLGCGVSIDDVPVIKVAQEV